MCSKECENSGNSDIISLRELSKMKKHLFGYPITNIAIKIGNRDIELKIVDDPDRFLDKLCREDGEGRLYLPYWAYLWESAIGLARHVSGLGDSLLGKHILEIGCGFGLVGIVACQAGGKVVFTDFEHDALLFAKHNAQHNNADTAAFIQMDWNRSCFQSKFDFILASDVIYEAQNWQPIIDLLKEHLTHDGIALLSEPNRKNTGKFFKELRLSGFTFEKSTCSISLDNRKSKINLYTIKRAT